MYLCSSASCTEVVTERGLCAGCKAVIAPVAPPARRQPLDWQPQRKPLTAPSREDVLLQAATTTIAKRPKQSKQKADLTDWLAAGQRPTVCKPGNCVPISLERLAVIVG